MKRYQPKDYEIRVWWSEDDDAFLAQVLDMPGIMTHGDTPEDAARENYVALQLALDSLHEAGQEAPLPGSRAGFHASSAGASP
jgi:predicted RNase H-like HicB family nuclease